MKKHHKTPLPDAEVRNPVAKFAHQFNKAQVFCDKKAYRRNNKHRKQEIPLITLSKVMSRMACFSWTLF